MRATVVWSVLVLSVYFGLCWVIFRVLVQTDDSHEAETLCGREVKTMKTSLLMVIAVAGCAGSGAGESQGLLPPAMRGPNAGFYVDALPVDSTAPADVLAAPDLGGAPDTTTAPDLRPAFPACAELGYRETAGASCEDRRTRDQAYSCKLCGATPPPQPCVSEQSHPGDLPWLCVASCGDCAAVIVGACSGAGPCKVRLDDGGAL